MKPKLVQIVVAKLFFLFFVGCSSLSDEQSSPLIEGLSPEEIQKNYTALKERTFAKARTYNTATLDDLGHFLHHQLTDSIFQYWYGTPWDYNGVTVHPRQGSIACGYFVTTTLQHCGIKLERVTLAQQAASKIIRSLCTRSSIRSFSNGNYEKLKKHLLQQPDGLYIIGLDNHVAFISKNDTTLRAIHAAPPGVKNQPIDDCYSVVHSQYHVIGSLTGNKELLKHWMNEKKIISKI